MQAALIGLAVFVVVAAAAIASYQIEDDRKPVPNIPSAPLTCKQKVAIVVLVTAVCALMMAAAFAHPPEHMQLHNEFYRKLVRPDTGTSCCNDRDCYPTEAKFQNGRWWAVRREDGLWIPISDEKILHDQVSPDRRAHLCAPPPDIAAESYKDPNFIYCFVKPEIET